MVSTETVVKRKGFTLIELLVVIATIAILAAILFPVFARARENARRASCMSNMKQMGLGMFQYSQDYDERLPFLTCGNVTLGAACTALTINPGAKPWFLGIQPYIKSMQILVCPSDTATATAADTKWNAIYVEAGIPNVTAASTAQDLQKYLPLSYAGNYRTGDASLALASINFPAQLFLVGEMGPRTTITSASAGTWYMQPGYANSATDGRWSNGKRHFDGRTWLFADGHVKWLIDLGGPTDGADAIMDMYKTRGVYSFVTDGS